MTQTNRPVPVVNTRPKAAQKSTPKAIPKADVELTEEQISDSYFKTMKDARTKDLKARTRALYASIDAQTKGQDRGDSAESSSASGATLGNPPDKPKSREVEFSKKEVLREEVEIYR